MCFCAVSINHIHLVMKIIYKTERKNYWKVSFIKFCANFFFFLTYQSVKTINKLPTKHCLIYCLSKVSANDKTCNTCNIFSPWLRPCLKLYPVYSLSSKSWRHPMVGLVFTRSFGVCVCECVWSYHLPIHIAIYWSQGRSKDWLWWVFISSTSVVYRMV